jgi:hypothetical protein
LPKEWDGITAELKGLKRKLKAAETFEDEHYPRWRQEAVRLLPAACFLWRVDFEEAFHRAYAAQRVTLPYDRSGERELNYSPLIPQELAAVIIEGFTDRLIDPSLFQQSYWNLAQLLGWVHIRDRDAVQQHSESHADGFDAASIPFLAAVLRRSYQLSYATHKRHTQRF